MVPDRAGVIVPIVVVVLLLFGLVLFCRWRDRRLGCRRCLYYNPPRWVPAGYKEAILEGTHWCSLYKRPLSDFAPCRFHTTWDDVPSL